jgi:hypothetical protein
MLIRSRIVLAGLLLWASVVAAFADGVAAPGYITANDFTGGISGGGVPAWVLRANGIPANAQLGFSIGQYYGCTLASCISVTRASAKTDLLPSSASGLAYNTFGNNVPAITPGLGILIEEARTNQLLNSTVPATQTTGSLAATAQTLWVNGSGSATLSNGTATGCTGTATNGSPVTFTPTAGTCVVTVTGSLNAFQLEAGSFGTSLIVTAGTTAQRNADGILITGPFVTFLKGANASIIAQVGPTKNYTNFARVIGSSPVGQSLPQVGGGATTDGIYNGTTALSATGGNISTASVKIGLSWAPSARSIVGNNGTVATDANSQISDTNYFLGASAASGTLNFDGYIASIAVWNTKIPDTALKGLTQ